MDNSVTPELATKVLTANLRNVMSKIAAGKTLSKDERTEMEEFARTQDDLQKSRQAALIRKWSQGGRLTSSEISEITDILPEQIIQAHQRAEPIPNPLRSENNYLRKHSEYAIIYGFEKRTIKRWIQTGREANPPELPPLDDPSAMPSWWGKYMTWRVPDKIIEAARAAKAAESPAPLSPVAVPVPIDSPLPPSPPVSVEESGELGLQGSLARLRDAERKAYNAWQLVLSAAEPNDGEIKNKQRIWTDIADQLRATEKASPDILQASGDLVSKSELQKVLAEIHTTIAQSFRAMIRRVLPKIQNLTPTEADAIWNEEVDRVFAALRTNEFTAPIPE
ncbi:MAG: hypothetical protein B9S32_13920 [Verrucomicrobia bacterium Tous-C9LFEB]|nr:MAG: hypothetical protein B9S32_13920 [Verrucomicrobia bacterium Tous-C9LFEB]